MAAALPPFLLSFLFGFGKGGGGPVKFDSVRYVCKRDKGHSGTGDIGLSSHPSWMENPTETQLVFSRMLIRQSLIIIYSSTETGYFHLANVSIQSVVSGIIILPTKVS